MRQAHRRARPRPTRHPHRQPASSSRRSPGRRRPTPRQIRASRPASRCHEPDRAEPRRRGSRPKRAGRQRRVFQGSDELVHVERSQPRRPAIALGVPSWLRRGLPAALQDYVALKPLLSEVEYRYQPRICSESRESDSAQFFRPILLYRHDRIFVQLLI